MKNHSQIMTEINKIISFLMVKGVQPHDLIDSIFEKEYHDIEVHKKNEQIHLLLTYSDCHDEGVSTVKMKYIYNSDKKLLSVEQKIDSSNFVSQWNRAEKLDEMLISLARMIPNNHDFIKKVRLSIPSEYESVFYPYLKLVS